MEVSGNVQVEFKVISEEAEEASVVAALVAAVALGVVLAPVAEWAAGSELAAGVGAGVRQLIVCLFPVVAR